jgi:MYXO-CTERM domain-containing protein
VGGAHPAAARDSGARDVGVDTGTTVDVGVEVDAGKVDAGEVDAGLMELTDEGSCGCRTTRPSSAGGGLASALTALAWLTIARRRRQGAPSSA